MEKVKSGEFLLNDIKYEITSAILFSQFENSEIILFPEIDAQTNDKTVDFDMQNLILYHNNGFNTHTHSFNQLKGKKFVWTEECNEDDEEAGTLYVQSHELLENGIIEILDITSEKMLIKWSGNAFVGWSEKYYDNVPFETIFSVDIPQYIYTINPYKSTKSKIDDDTEIEILNLENFNNQLKKLPSHGHLEGSNFKLEFQLTHKNIRYLGEVNFTDNKNNFQLEIDENCPFEVEFLSIDYNFKIDYEIFSFSIEQ